MNSEDQDMDIIKKACQELGEHFDSVQIFVTRHEAGECNGTICINYGSGNSMARYGQVKDWTVKQDEFTRITARGED